MFPVYGRKCLSRKAFHNWVEKFSQGRSKVANDARSDAEVAEKTVKRVLCCGFRRTGTSISTFVENMSRNKCFVQFWMSHVLNLIPISNYLLTLLDGGEWPASRPSNFTPGKDLRYPLDGGLIVSGPQSRSGSYALEKNSWLCRESNHGRGYINCAIPAHAFVGSSIILNNNNKANR
jgi:hypothetical protein